MPKNDLKKIANFFFETGMLKRKKRSGVLLAGAEYPESIADHTTRAALIAYVLAYLEKADPEKSALICLIHDLPEARLGDQHKIASRYLSRKKSEEKAFEEQLENLPLEISQLWQKLYQEKEKRNTLEGIVAQDADWLEVAITARELICLGYKGMRNWIDNVRIALETNSAKELLKVIEKSDINDWWQGLKKMTYQKLDDNKLKKLKK